MCTARVPGKGGVGFELVGTQAESAEVTSCPGSAAAGRVEGTAIDVGRTATGVGGAV